MSAMRMFQRAQQELAGIVGAVLALWNESSEYLRDEWRRASHGFDDLRDRCKDLEDQVVHTASGPGGGTNTPPTHDQQVLLIDLGSNSATVGSFPTNPAIVTPNAVNNTGTGVGSTIQWVNKSAGDLQRVGRHTLRLTPAGTPGTPTPSQAIRLFSLVIPRGNFDRTPRVESQPLSAAAAALQLAVVPSVAGYDIYASAGTITAGSAYDLQVTVNPG